MHTLKRFLEQQMGVAPVAAGEDTQWTWGFHLGWPDWVLVLFWTIAAGYIVSIYLREGAAARPVKLFLAVLRLSLIGMLLLMLGELEVSIDRTGLPYLIVAIDDSESQGVRDRAASSASVAAEQSPTRLEQVVGWLGKDGGASLRDLTLRHKLRFYAHSTTPRRLGQDTLRAEQIPELLTNIADLRPTGPESLLGSNLRGIINDLRGAPPSAIILPTDGVTTRGETLAQVAQYAARKQIPVFPIGVGDPEKPRDLEIGDLLVDDTVFVGDDVTFEAKVTGRGFAGKDVNVFLKGEGIDSPISQTVRIEADGKPARVRLTYRPRRDAVQKKGAFTYTLEVPVAEREIQVENNKVEKAITFIDEKVRVLIVDTGPRYEFRYLKTLLDRQNTMEVRVLLLEADPEHVQQDRVAIGYFPASLEDLAQYDVLVLGDVKPSFFQQAQLANMKEFVRRGGGMLVVAGPQFCPQSFRDSPLEDLLPVRVGAAPAVDSAIANASGFRPHLTLEGSTSPIFRFVPDDDENQRIWNSLPPLYWYASTEKLKPGAQALLEHPTDVRDGKPATLAATQFYGAGRTYFQAFDGTWRWRYQVEDLYHARYWIQAIRYLSRAKLLGKNRTIELTVDRAKYRRGDPVQIRVQFLDETKAPRGEEGVAVALERLGSSPTKASLELKRSPGRRDSYEGTFTQSEDGAYKVRLPSLEGEGAGQMARFVVAPPPGEMDNIQLAEDELRDLAKQTGGRYYPMAEAQKLFTDGLLPYGRRVAINTDAPYPLWRKWPMLSLFILVLGLEWIVRKRQRLV